MTSSQQTFETIYNEAKKSFGSFVYHLALFENTKVRDDFLQSLSFVSGETEKKRFPSNMVGQALEIEDGLAAVLLLGQLSIEQNNEILSQAKHRANEMASATHVPDESQDQSYHPIWVFNLYEAKRKIDGEPEKQKKKIVRKSDAKAEWGVCPNCDHTRGTVGEPCHQGPCEARGYHLVPEPLFRQHLKESREMGRLPDPNIGLLIDRYHLINRLGEGAGGGVYLAYHIPPMRKVVVRLISGFKITQETREDFEKEARDAIALYHPAIAQIFDFGIDSRLNVPYLVWEYVQEGKTLEEAIVAHGLKPWPEDRIKDIASQILEGLQLAHENWFAHGNLTPRNIMLMPMRDKREIVKILSFGLVKILEIFPEYMEKIGFPAIMASARYASPELIAGTDEVDQSSDLYSVGAIIFEMMTGVSVCPGRTLPDIYLHKLMSDFDPLSEISPEKLPEAWRNFFRRALARRKEERFASAVAMKKDILSTGKAHPPQEIDFPEVLLSEALKKKTRIADFVHKVTPPDPDEEGKPKKSRKLIPVDSRLIRFEGSQAGFVLPLKAQKDGAEGEVNPIEGRKARTPSDEAGNEGKQIEQKKPAGRIFLWGILIVLTAAAAIVLAPSFMNDQGWKKLDEIKQAVFNSAETAKETPAGFEAHPLELGYIEVRGSLPASTLRNIIDSHLKDIETCIASPGLLTIELVISPTGDIQTAIVKKKGRLSENEKACLIDKILQWTFPSPEGVVHVTCEITS